MGERPPAAGESPETAAPQVSFCCCTDVLPLRSLIRHALTQPEEDSEGIHLRARPGELWLWCCASVPGWSALFINTLYFIMVHEVDKEQKVVVWMTEGQQGFFRYSRVALPSRNFRVCHVGQMCADLTS